MTLAWYSWLIGFGLTLLIEVPIAGACLKTVEPRLGRRLVLIACANLSTHPLVWYFFPRIPCQRWMNLSLSELWALAFEAFFYGLVIERTSAKRAIGVSLIANGISCGIGAVLVASYGRWFY